MGELTVDEMGFDEGEEGISDETGYQQEADETELYE